jgi:hypothetical protein
MGKTTVPGVIIGNITGKIKGYNSVIRDLMVS